MRLIFFIVAMVFAPLIAVADIASTEKRCVEENDPSNYRRGVRDGIKIQKSKTTPTSGWLFSKNIETDDLSEILGKIPLKGGQFLYILPDGSFATPSNNDFRNDRLGNLTSPNGTELLKPFSFSVVPPAITISPEMFNQPHEYLQ